MNVPGIISTFFIGAFAAFFGSMVGGGGLVSIPFLIFLGLPPHIAIATNRLGSFGLQIGAITRFLKSKEILWKFVPWFFILAAMGAFVGTNILIDTDEGVLKGIIVVVMLTLLPVILIKPKLGIVHTEHKGLRKGVGYGLYFVASAWAAFFAGGASTIIFYIMMLFFGFSINKANATQRVSGVALSIVSLWIFISNGMIHWEYGFALFFGMLVGGYIGIHTALKKGNAWVKMIFAAVVIVSSLVLLFK